MVRIAANLSMLFNELPFQERFAAAAAAGFKAVEYLFPYDWPISDLKDWLDEAGLKQVLFNSQPGDWDKGERGLACLPDRVSEFREGLEKVAAYAEALGVPAVHIMAGVEPEDYSAKELHDTFVGNVAYAAQRLGEIGVKSLIEPINRVDIPDYYLSDFGEALAIVRELEVREIMTAGLQFDIYHCAKIHGSVPERIAQCSEYIRHFQIAGLPDRHEPSDATLPIKRIVDVIEQNNPECWVGCEYWPKTGTTSGLKWMNEDARFSF
jgi:hydroxypyruvate isomerase